MQRITRRSFLRTTGLVGTSAVLADGLLGAARAGKPINFAGWVFKPDTVQDYVNFYNQKLSGQVKYEAIPWAQYHPTMETRAFGGEIFDVMYCAHNFRQRWYENGFVRPLDDLPGIDELKKKMNPQNLESLKAKDGKLAGVPYLTGDWYVQRQWCLISGLDNPYPEMYEHPEIIASYDRWVDLKLLRKQYEKGRVIAAYKEPWYSEYDVKAVPIVHNLIRGGMTVPQGLKELVKLQKSLE